MTIETKYDIGDMVWFLYNGEETTDIVELIIISNGESKISIKYELSKFNDKFGEYELFPTKQDLINSL